MRKENKFFSYCKSSGDDTRDGGEKSGFQLGVMGKSNSDTLKVIISFHPMCLKDSIPLQRGHKTAALVGLLINNRSPVFCKHHT